MNRLNRVSVWSGLVVLALVVCGVTPARSQESAAKEFRNSLVKGAWALQFQIDDDFTLKSFEGTTLSLKKHSSPRVAWRAGLSVNYSYADTDILDKRDGSRSWEYRGTTIETVQLTLQRLSYLNPRARVNLFWGIGPRTGYQYRDDSRIVVSRSEELIRSNVWSVGVSATLGVEWFVTGSISLLAEYGTSLMYEHNAMVRTTTTYSADKTSVRKVDSRGYKVSFAPDAVMFGLSAFF